MAAKSIFTDTEVVYHVSHNRISARVPDLLVFQRAGAPLQRSEQQKTEDLGMMTGRRFFLGGTIEMTLVKKKGRIKLLPIVAGHLDVQRLLVQDVIKLEKQTLVMECNLDTLNGRLQISSRMKTLETVTMPA